MVKEILKRIFVTALVIVIACTFVFTSCDLTEPDEYTASHLSDYDVPDFDKAKFRSLERLFRDYFVEELPPPETMAERVAALYFENFDGKIDTADAVSVTDALLNCYVWATGDRFSVYRTAEENEEYNTSMSGNFFGIGVSVTYNREADTITVTDVYEGGSAYEAGIKTGDLIIGVDGARLSDIGYNETINRIRGEENTAVNITVLRQGKELTFTAVRRAVVVESVRYSIDEDKIGYIKISSFKDNTAEQFAKAVKFMEESGAVGVIYDLRDNPGGYLHAVVEMLSYICPSGTTIVSFSNGYAKPIKDNNSLEFTLPSVVICNGDTASAGELFTSALRDFDEIYGYFEVTLVGKTTYGKGIMQKPFYLGDGSTVTMTVAYYNPPSGENYNGEGIEPNVIVDMLPEGDSQLAAAYAEINELVK